MHSRREQDKTDELRVNVWVLVEERVAKDDSCKTDLDRRDNHSVDQPVNCRFDVLVQVFPPGWWLGLRGGVIEREQRLAELTEFAGLAVRRGQTISFCRR